MVKLDVFFTLDFCCTMIWLCFRLGVEGAYDLNHILLLFSNSFLYKSQIFIFYLDFQFPRIIQI